MRGYVVKKGNAYYAVIYEGTDPATGRERRRWHPAGPRKRDAERMVSERLGHASPAFTMTVYQHVLPGMQADAATTFAARLAARRNPSEETY